MDKIAGHHMNNLKRLLMICAAVIAVPAIAQTRVTPSAGIVSTITTGGTAVTVLNGPANGCYITNPLTAIDQGISPAEALYIDPTTTATTTGNGTTVSLVPGQTWFCPPYSSVAVSVNAATTAHAFVVVRW